MKKILFVTLLTTLSLTITPFVHAQEKDSEDDKSTQEKVTQEAQNAIEKIKDAVASKVAELNLVEKRGVFGKVTEVSTTEITIEDEEGNQRLIDIDELTRFEGERQSEDIGISDIKEGNTISAVGLYNKDTERLLARFITQKINIPTYVSGAIQNIDNDEYTITVVDDTGKEYLVDIERSTDTMLYKNDELTDSGFSKLKTGERVVVTGLPNKDEENRYAAERILHFADIPPSEETKSHLGEEKQKGEKYPTPTPKEE